MFGLRQQLVRQTKKAIGATMPNKSTMFETKATLMKPQQRKFASTATKEVDAVPTAQEEQLLKQIEDMEANHPGLKIPANFFSAAEEKQIEQWGEEYVKRHGMPLEAPREWQKLPDGTWSVWTEAELNAIAVTPKYSRPTVNWFGETKPTQVIPMIPIYSAGIGVTHFITCNFLGPNYWMVPFQMLFTPQKFKDAV